MSIRAQILLVSANNVTRLCLHEKAIMFLFFLFVLSDQNYTGNEYEQNEFSTSENDSVE